MHTTCERDITQKDVIVSKERNSFSIIKDNSHDEEHEPGNPEHPW